jgi:hypothetical protein
MTDQTVSRYHSSSSGNSVDSLISAHCQRDEAMLALRQARSSSADCVIAAERMTRQFRSEARRRRQGVRDSENLDTYLDWLRQAASAKSLEYVRVQREELRQCLLAEMQFIAAHALVCAIGQTRHYMHSLSSAGALQQPVNAPGT